MGLDIESVLEEARSLLERRKYKRALAAVAVIDRAALSGEDFGELCLLRSECSLHVGGYSDTSIDDGGEAKPRSSV